MNEKALEKVNNGQSGFELAQRQAKAYASSTLVPTAYRNNIPNVLIAMELANRIDASVFAVMQKMYIVHGKPAFEATFLIATVNACGRFTPIRYRFEGKQGSDNWGCRAYATDKESGEECVGPLVNMAMVKKEKWDENPKWKSMPELMFHYRAAAFWTRVFAPELSMGMHSQDEIEEMGPVIDIGNAAVVADSPVEERKAEVAARPVEVPDDMDVFGELQFAISNKHGLVNGKKWFEEQCEKAGWDSVQLTEAQASALLDVLNNQRGDQNETGGNNNG
jgi:hypothetical protein